jgi:uncharacterized protein DUF3616
MAASKVEEIALDYAGVNGLDDILKNLSGVAADGRFLWTASDEGRTIECLEPDGDGYRLRKQHSLDKLFRNFAEESEDKNSPDEADVESLAVCDGALWICGSHCMVRRQTKRDRQKERDKLPYPLRAEFNTRAGRHLLGKVALKDEGGGLAKPGSNFPFRSEKGNLHGILKENPFLEPFIDLPSKENGLDVEGFSTSDGKSLFLGLRGPRVDRYAVVVEIRVTNGLKPSKGKSVTHFLDLEGLAVRDLAHFDDDILVLAGPVGESPGPFDLFRWRPRHSRCAQKATNLDWPIDPKKEKPEAICRLDRNGRSGLIVLYDSPDPCKRINGSRYTADWIPHPK